MAAVAPAPLISGRGTLDAEWRVALAARHLQGLRDGPYPCSRVVVVAPHPDDEVLACGGLLSRHAAQGGRTLIVAVTDGEASHRGSPGWSATALAAVRRSERRRGLGYLGLPDPAIVALRLPDGDVRAHGGWLQACLQRCLRPADIVVSTWLHDGHPDHDATALATIAACRRSGARLIQAPVWMWHWAHPGDPRVPWRRLRRFPLAPADVRRKQRALFAHRSQLDARQRLEGPVLGEAILGRLSRRDEYFFV